MLPYEGKDGIKRNWLRAKYEWKVYREHMKNEPRSHAPFLNSLVEMCDSVHWLAGHLWFITLIGFILSTGLAIWTCL